MRTARALFVMLVLGLGLGPGLGPGPGLLWVTGCAESPDSRPGEAGGADLAPDGDGRPPQDAGPVADGDGPGAHDTLAGSGGSHRDLIWYDERGSQADLLKESPDRWFRGPEVVVMRGSWIYPATTFCAFKGGDNGVSHSHLDLGTFVLDALGQRWAIDLGPDDYNLPEYFGNLRWTYYRLGTAGQNTLLWAGGNQGTKAKAPITLFKASAKASLAITDLTGAYSAGGATRVWRGMALLDDRQRVLLVDEIEASKVVDVIWGMHTKASITLSGGSATLTLGGKQLTAKLLGAGSFSQNAVNLAAPRKPSTGISKLKVSHKTVAGGTLTIAVLFTPAGASTATVTPRPLSEWKTLGPVK